MDKTELQSCRPDDPRRCQGMGGNNQCSFLAIEDQKWCPIHISAHNRTIKKKALNMYRVEQYEKRLREFKEHAEANNLQSELAVARMTLEEVLHTASKHPLGLAGASPAIANLVTTIERVVINTTKLQRESGLLMDQSKVLRIADNIIAAVKRYVEDPDILLSISTEVREAIATVLDADGEA